MSHLFIDDNLNIFNSIFLYSLDKDIGPFEKLPTGSSSPDTISIFSSGERFFKFFFLYKVERPYIISYKNPLVFGAPEYGSFK